MKRLTLLLLFLTFCYFLPSQQEGDLSSLPHSRAAQFPVLTLSAAYCNTDLTADALEQLEPWRELFKRRPIGLNDGHEQALAVYSCDTRPLFVYVHSLYRTYAQTFRNVAINLSDWRGPPEKFAVNSLKV